ncbi:8283_t:CDS:1, partial [Cetraspora pellucida]
HKKNNLVANRKEGKSHEEGINNIVQTRYTRQRSKIFGFTPESLAFFFLPGNNGEGDYQFKGLREKRAKEYAKSLEYQRQFPKDPLSEKIKRFFE